MKSGTKRTPELVPATQGQLTLPIQSVLQDVQHAFYGLCINAGKQVLAAMMEADRVALCGPKGVPDADRRALRGGSTRGSVVLGGQRISVRRPRARALDAGELELPSFTWAAGADPLNAATMAAIAAGASIRRYATTPLPWSRCRLPSGRARCPGAQPRAASWR
jgi:putative transposase